MQKNALRLITGFISGVIATGSMAAFSFSPLRQISFEGRTQADSKNAPYRLKIGRLDPNRPTAPLLAIIQDPKGNRIAECEVRSFEKIRSRIPKTMHLECSASPPPLTSTHLSLNWTKTGVHLLSGDWISGHKEISIQVDRDLFSHPRLSEPETIQLASQ